MIINLGDAPFKAFITVTYPNGTCTVSLGDKSFPHTGGGTHTFTVNKKGTWTVTATSNAGVVETQNVSLTYVGQVASVTLTGIFYAIKDGVSAVGGWSGIRWDDGIRVPNMITVKGTSGGRLVFAFLKEAGAARSGATVNFSYFRTMRVTYDVYKSNAFTSFHLCACDANVKNYPSFVNLVPGQPQSTDLKSQVRTLDVSGVNDTRYIGLWCICDWRLDSSVAELRIQNLELIP